MSTQDSILIVDDHKANRSILSHSLRKAGYETFEAANGLDAVRIACEELPSLVLLDIAMPGLDGLEVCGRLKRDERTKDVPVIFLTCRSDPEDIEKAFAVGGSDYVTKPFHLGEIKARASVHLQLREAKRALEATHVQLLHAQKMESIGQLAAGIAHEINTPTQFVGDNARFIQEALAELFPLLVKTGKWVAAASNTEGVEAELAKALQGEFEKVDLDYLCEEIPRALEQSIEGIDRISSIVKAMKEFSHPGVKEMAHVDLNRSIESTVTVATNEWKYVAEVQLELDPRLPHVPCYPGEFNQVILNMIVNAAHAIAGVGAKEGSSDKGAITISTALEGDHVMIAIADTGSGIPDSALPRIFDPFFTTKGVGKGTGQGLSIAHDVVVNKHGGTLEVETELGRGTVFTIRLPISQPGRAAA